MGACLAVELASEDGRYLRQNALGTSKQNGVTADTLLENVAIVRNSQDFIS